MTLEQLAQEYQRTARLLAEGLSQLKAQLPQARGDHALELRRRAQVMAEELRDTVRIAQVLHDYYR